VSLLEVTGLSVSFGGLLAVDDVSFAVRPDTIMALIGPNGAGKTTTIDALSGFVPSATGTITLVGQRIDSLPAHERARAGLARTFQSVELFDDLSVRENLLVAATTPRWWSPFVDACTPKRSARGIDVDFALDMMDLSALAGARPPELSHGQRQLAGVARALASRPKLVLLDEPAAGLDPTETAALGALLRTLPSEGIGVLLVDHDMSLILEVSDEIIVLDFGRVIADGPAAAVRHDPAVIAAYLGDPT
jgi:ABC-type branched-subunit amino acid transport system ATPase component